MATPGTPFKPLGVTCSTVERRAEVAELEDALDSKSSGASPRAGSTPAFGISTPLCFAERSDPEDD